MAKKRRSRGQGTLFKRNENGPWMASWYDHNGKRRERSTRTTDRRSAERILAKHVADAALRRDGVIDARKDKFAVENRKPLTEHIRDYIGHCRHAGHAEKHIEEKVRHLKRMREGIRAARFSDLTADSLENHLRNMREDGLSARTVNFCRQITVAFMNWCKQTGRIESNPLTVVAKMDERKDRRRIRRPLTDEELSRLLTVAEPKGRKARYLAAAWAGLRKGDLQRLIWADIDFVANTITVRDGKANREDIIPMHDQLAAELKKRRDESKALPKTKVFPETVTNLTRLKDFLAAGLAREEVVTDADGNPVMIGKRKPRPKTHIVTEDGEGRVIDLHAMRTTLGTNLARAGVAPQLAQKIMRHGDYRTTLKHYTVLGSTDTSNAINQLPAIENPRRQAATGTYDENSQKQHQLYPQQLGHETERNGTIHCDKHQPQKQNANVCKSLEKSSLNKALQGNGNGCDKSGRWESNPHDQLGRPDAHDHNVLGENHLQKQDDSVCTSVCTCSEKKADIDPELREIVEAWPNLPEPIKTGIVTLANSVKYLNNNKLP
ncbi:tyrosine-type recombinase/integrase [Planctomycetota bacterium]